MTGAKPAVQGVRRNSLLSPYKTTKPNARINLNDLSKSFDGGKRFAVHPLSLEVDDGETSPAQRNFCKVCGSALWLFDPRWPELLHPHASAIDSKLPRPPEFADIMCASAAPWVDFHRGGNIGRFDDYPDESIADWHKSRGLWDA